MALITRTKYVCINITKKMRQGFSTWVKTGRGIVLRMTLILTGQSHGRERDNKIDGLPLTLCKQFQRNQYRSSREECTPRQGLIASTDVRKEEVK